ncbi:MAG: type I-C CRISPR-associated protein Cas8c/Csd1 [Lachnospiraceae bacterium]|nr:type I-C CRISPR-associated protein Cas8c/Csd1 [Lachnospiraceae bacterium]
MILQSLVQHYECLLKDGKVPRRGWCITKVSFSINLRKDGTILGIMPLKETVQRGKKQIEIPKEIEVPEMVSRSSGISANFLCDNSKYILGIDRDETDKRSKKCFLAAKEKHLKILENVDSPYAEAVRNFFENWDPEKAHDDPEVQKEWDGLTAGGNLIFYINEKFAQHDEAIIERWEQEQGNCCTETKGICLVTGKKTEISRIHTAIKGVQGAQSSGALLVSFNAPAFESYGKSQSFNAPVSNFAVFAYTTALNYLLSKKEYVKQIGDTTVVFWAEDANPECQNLFLAASEPSIDNQELVRGVFRNLSKGSSVDVESVLSSINIEQRFYILGLSPNSARLSIRFFYVDQFGNILKHIQEHYEHMKIIHSASDNLDYYGVWRMLQETVNKKARDKKPQPGMAGRTFEAILSGGRYPEGLYLAVLARIRAEQDQKENKIYKITRGRAAIIKAYLLRNCLNLTMKGEDFVELNENCDETAYVLGREFAILEAIQEDANPGINATIKDRYFNSACATPGIIFPVLFKLKNSHTRKLEKGKQIYYENQLIELQGKIPSSGCPKRLTLEQQGLFILGYYHQTQRRYKKKEEKK